MCPTVAWIVCVRLGLLNISLWPEHAKDNEQGLVVDWWPFLMLCRFQVRYHHYRQITSLLSCRDLSSSQIADTGHQHRTTVTSVMTLVMTSAAVQHHHLCRRRGLVTKTLKVEIIRQYASSAAAITSQLFEMPTCSVCLGVVLQLHGSRILCPLYGVVYIAYNKSAIDLTNWAVRNSLRDWTLFRCPLA